MSAPKPLSLGRAIAIAIAIAWLMMLGVGGWQERVARDQQIISTKTSVANLASSLAQDAASKVEVADTFVAGIVTRLETDGVGPDALKKLNEMLPARVGAMNRLASIIVLDKDGNWLATSLQKSGPNLSDRDSFRHARDSLDRGPFIGKPVVGRLTGRWLITVSRRVQSVGGAFAGVVVANIAISDFVDHYAELDLGPKSLVTLLTPGGTLLARYPWDPNAVGRDLSKAKVFSALKQAANGSYQTTAVLDGVEGFSGYRRSDRFPLIVVASVSVDNALRTWRVNASLHAAIILVLTIGVGLLGIYLMRQMRRSQAAAQAFRRSEEFLDRASRIAGVGGWEVDLATNKVSWSAEAHQIYGLEPGQIPTIEHAIGSFAPEARPVITAAFERCAIHGNGWDLELPFDRADGRRLWVHSVASLILVDGKPDRVTGTIQDITDRVIERLALRASEERYRLLLESGMFEALYMLDTTGIVETWNAGAERLKGYAPDEIIGHNFSTFFAPEDVASGEPARLLAAARDTGSLVTDGWRVRKDGTRFFAHVQIDALRREDGTLRGFAKVTRDVTARRIEEEQREIIIEAAPNGMMIVDETGTITLANSNLHQIFGYPRGSLIGQSPEILVPEAFGSVRGTFTSDRAMAAARPFIGRRLDGGVVSIEIMLSPIETPRGAIVVASLFDVTERQQQLDDQREADQQALQASAAAIIALDTVARHLTRARDLADAANRAKSRFLAGMSHELRTPLNGIMGYAQLLRLEGGLNLTQGGRVDAMLGAGKHLLQMITRVLDLSEIESERVDLRPVAFDVQPVAATCLDMMRPVAEAKGLALRIVVVPGTPRELVADATRLRQVLLNLLGNAVKFTGRGRIELRLKPVADGSMLRIEVADTGAGIPDEQRGRLFQEFERLDTEATRSAEGAGLGLSLSARLAGIMGGRLGHEHNPGGGSVFWLELPLSTDAIIPEAASKVPEAQSAPSVATTLPARTLRVLVVDDVLMNRDIAGSFLRSAGHEVTLAEDGAEAVAAVAGADFDVVLMDVRMPEMDGLEATRRIRTLEGARGRVPIVALTAQAFTEQVVACRDAGMDGHLAKPFEIDALLTAVARAATAGPRPGKPGHHAWADAVNPVE